MSEKAIDRNGARRFAGVGMLLALAGLLATCDKTPTRSIATVYDARLEITGPASVPPDRTAQFNAILRRSDGTTRDATAETQWLTRDQGVLTISPTGQATGHKRGETQISASIPGLQGTKTVFVLPDGTFRLSGAVRNAGVPVGGARVEVTGGPAAGLVTMSDNLDGGYRLYGVSGDTSILATKDGYQSQEQRLFVTDHQTLNLDVTLVRVDNVSGTYTMTITASELCRARLPEEARTRTYTVVLTQSGRDVEATLSGAAFAIDAEGRGNRFRGWLEPERLTLDLQPHDYYYYYFLPGRHPDVIEQIAGGYLVLAGAMRLSLSPRRLLGRLNGTMDLFTMIPPAGQIAQCLDSFGNGHQVVLSR
ncbi:MAG: carboxypeptidase regulatory-like domain-containing protein [Vicinamibacterales bacterium]